MNQPGESEIQKTPVQEAPATTVIKKKIILPPYKAHEGFLFYNKVKRATACFLVEYIDKKIGAFYEYLQEKKGDTEEDSRFLRRLTYEQVASLWWERDYNERITTLRKNDDDHYERLIWEYGAYDATLLLSSGLRNKANGYEILDAIMRDCWECRHKMISSEKRKKIQEMTPATRAFYDGGGFTYDEEDFDYDGYVYGDDNGY
jgi:hypothetical protein